MNELQSSELILNPDGSVYHLHILPEDLADIVILVGDQNRVPVVAGNFDSVEVDKQSREFRTMTGTFRGRRVSAVSTGIGTDNIDIVVAELDALANIDLERRALKAEHRSLTLVRIGTSGALQPDIPVDTPVAAAMGCGFDGLLNFYGGRDRVSDLAAQESFKRHMAWRPLLATPYFVPASRRLLGLVAHDMRQGITVSAPGFYGPQGRVLRLPLADPGINAKLSAFRHGDLQVTNYEMECSAIYGLAALLGHEALTVCNIIANRSRGEFSKDYKPGVERTIRTVLERLTA